MDMSQIVAFMPDLGLLLGAGLLAGFVAGLFGVGGGTVTVPVLFFWFMHMGISADVAMHSAVATSLATIIGTSLSSSRAHEKRGAIDHALLKLWAPFIAFGAVGGALLAAIMSGNSLRGIFGGFLLCVALYMLLAPNGKVLAQQLPSVSSQKILSFVLGVLSSLVGIGGGAVSVPYLSMHNVPMQKAVGTSSAFGVIVAVPGVIGFIIGGWAIEGLPPYSLGYVSLMGLSVLLPATALMAPVGAKLAHSLDKNLLRRIFGGFLTFVAGKMLWGLISP